MSSDCEVCMTHMWQAAYRMGHQAKMCLQACANAQIHPMHAQSDLGICSRMIYSFVANDSLNGQGRHLSDCTDAQADLGLCCPHMLEDTFLHEAALSMCPCWQKP